MADHLLKKELVERERIFYSTALSAWIESRMEKDRSLLNLSVGGLGLIVTILTTVGVTSSFEILLNATAVIFFITTILSVLKVFDLNSKYLSSIIKNEKADDTKLIKYDNRIKRFFILGILLTLSSAFLSSTNKLIEGRWHMSENKDKNVPLSESLQGLNKFTPNLDTIKSLAGFADLKPGISSPNQDSGKTSGTSDQAPKK